MLTNQAQPYSSVSANSLNQAPLTNDPNSAVALYSDIQALQIPLLQPIEFCNRPELHLEEAAKHYLPQSCYEENDAYQGRLKYAYSNFQPFYRSLKQIAIGTALRKPIVLAENNNSPDWQEFLENVTLTGESITNFAKRLLDASIDCGMAGIFIDYPMTEEGLNLAQEKALALRPYFSLIPMPDVLGWQAENATTVIGDSAVYGTRLTQLRIRDTFTETDPDDEFRELSYPAVRVYDHQDPEQPVRWRLFVYRPETKNAPDKWVEQENGELSINVIPFCPCYAGAPDAFMRGRPLMLDIARLNLSHWQASADLAHSLHLTSTPTLVVKGVQNVGDSAGLEISPDKSLILNDPSAGADWIGAPSAGAQVTLERLRELEEAMCNLAPVKMQKKSTTGVEAAAAKKLDRAQSDSVLATIVDQLEKALNQAMAIAALYWQRPVASFDLPRDFLPGDVQPQELQQMAALNAAGLLSSETFLRWLGANEVLDGLDEWSPEEELQTIEEETPAIDPNDLPGNNPEAAPPTAEKPPEADPTLDGQDPERS